MKARILTCSYEDYLADRIGEKGPSLNSSVAKVLIDQSPAHAILKHPAFYPQDEDPSKCRDKGTVIHSLLLNKGKGIRIIDAQNFRTKAAQDQRDEAYTTGEVPLLIHEADDIQQAALVLQGKLADIGIDFKEGEQEFGIAWKSDGVLCRTSMDCWQESSLQILELKSTFSAHPNVCESQSLKLGYDIGFAARIDAITELYPDHAGRIEFLFVFVEIEPPYAVYVARPDGTFTHLGIQKWTRAKEIWKQCMESGRWPDYGKEIGLLSAPLWAIKHEMEEELA